MMRRKYRSTVAILSVLLLALQPFCVYGREWTIQSHPLNADLVAFNPEHGTVKLKKTDGEIISIAVTKFSKDDLNFIRYRIIRSRLSDEKKNLVIAAFNRATGNSQSDLPKKSTVEDAPKMATTTAIAKKASAADFTGYWNAGQAIFKIEENGGKYSIKLVESSVLSGLSAEAYCDGNRLVAKRWNVIFANDASRSSRTLQWEMVPVNEGKNAMVTSSIVVWNKMGQEIERGSTKYAMRKMADGEYEKLAAAREAYIKAEQARIAKAREEEAARQRVAASGQRYGYLPNRSAAVANNDPANQQRQAAEARIGDLVRHRCRGRRRCHE